MTTKNIAQDIRNNISKLESKIIAERNRTIDEIQEYVKNECAKQNLNAWKSSVAIKDEDATIIPPHYDDSEASIISIHMDKVIVDAAHGVESFPFDDLSTDNLIDVLQALENEIENETVEINTESVTK